MTKPPPADVVVTQAGGCDVALCWPSTRSDHEACGRAVIAFDQAEEVLRVIESIKRIMPGSRVVSRREVAEEQAARTRELLASGSKLARIMWGAPRLDGPVQRVRVDPPVASRRAR
jgi:hypothetical protein